MVKSILLIYKTFKLKSNNLKVVFGEAQAIN